MRGAHKHPSNKSKTILVEKHIATTNGVHRDANRYVSISQKRGNRSYHKSTDVADRVETWLWGNRETSHISTRENTEENNKKRIHPIESLCSEGIVKPPTFCETLIHPNQTVNIVRRKVKRTTKRLLFFENRVNLKTYDG